jgi:hypothetical protein
MFPLRVRPSFLTMALFSTTALCSLYFYLPPLQPLSPLWTSAPFKVLCPLQASVTSTEMSPYSHLVALRPSVPSMTLCLLHRCLSLLWPSAHSRAFCTLYGPLKTAEAKLTLSFPAIFFKTLWSKPPGLSRSTVFHICDNHHHRDIIGHCEKNCTNRDNYI